MMPNRRTIAAVATAACLVLCFAASAGPPDEHLYLHPTTQLNSSCTPYFVTGEDLNEDGKSDLVVGERCGFDFTVLLGRGDGWFDTTIMTGPPTMFPICIAVADLDSDGSQDLAVAPHPSDGPGVTVYKGDGSGEFGAPAYYLGGKEFVTTGDFNEDDHLDLLFPGVLTFNQGDGTFAGAVAVPFDTEWSVAAADFNGDGKGDYATTRYVYLGDGTGAFTQSFALPEGEEAGREHVTAGDLDGDEIPDLVTSFEADEEIAVVFGNGDGTFGSEQRYSVGLWPELVTIADLDEDGLSDVLVAASHNSVRVVQVFYGSGSGSLEPSVDYPLFGGWPNVVVADFNDDGLNDLAVATTSGDVRLSLADGPRSFPTNPNFATEGGQPSSFAICDFDSDGRADLAALDPYAPSEVKVWIADGASSFGSEIRSAVGTNPQSLVCAELTSDTHPDLAVANLQSNDVSILAGNGDGTFTALSSVASGSPSSVASGDLDDDELLDLVVTNRNGDTVSVLMGNGDGTFGGGLFGIGVGTDPLDLALGDFNGDELLDFVVVHETSEDAWVFVGDGDGTFTPAPSPNIYPAGTEPWAVEAADLDDDGDADFAVLSNADGVYVYLSHGDGTFAAGTLYPSEDQTLALHIADVDGDGIPDLVTAEMFSRSKVLLGNGDGTFGRTSYYANGGDTRGIGDFDLDGRLDLLGSESSWRTKLWIALNQTGPETFGFLADGTTLAWPSVSGALRYEIYRGDLSDLVDLGGDGLPDNGYGVCLSHLDDDDRDTHFVDTTAPTPGGAGFFYLRSVIDAQGDSGLGTNSAGQARLPQTRCP